MEGASFILALRLRYGVDRKVDDSMLDNLMTQLQTLHGISALGFLLAVAGGFVVGFSPSSFPLIPVIMGYVAGNRETKKREALILSVSFVLGIAFVNAALGVLFGFGGAFTAKLFGPKWNILFALVLIVIGLRLLGILKFGLPTLSPKGKKVQSTFGAFVFGMPFAFALCPYCIPIQLALLTAAAAKAPWYGGALLLVFGLTRGIPLLLGGVFTGILKGLSGFMKFTQPIEKGAGVVFLLLGGYYAYQFIQFIRLTLAY